MSNVLSLELPTDRPRRADRAATFQSELRQLAPAQSAQLRALASRAGVTQMEVARATLLALLHRHSGQDELLLSECHDTGSRRWTRSRLERATSVAELCRAGVTSIPRAAELLPVAAVLGSLPGPAAELARELVASAQEIEGALVLRIDYAAELWDASSVRRMLTHWECLLREASTDLGRPAAELELLSAAEREQILLRWNDTAVALPPELCVHQLFEAQAARSPDAVAVVFGAEALSYRELDQRAERLAALLRALGVGPDVLVGLCVERSIHMAVGLLAILKAGGAYVPMDPAYPKDRLGFMLADTRAPVLLTQRHLADVLPAYDGERVFLDEPWEQRAPEHAREREPVRPHHLAYVIYTSGSTGRPKGICLGHAPLVNLLRWHDRTLLRGARTLQFASLSFDASFHEMFAAWSSGGSVYLITEAVRRDVASLMQFISEHAIEKVILPVVVLQQLAEHFGSEPQRFRSLREVTTTGEQLHVTTPIVRLFKQLPGCSFHNHYGPSETHVVTALTLSADPEEWPTHPSIGRPIDNTQLYILDKHGCVVPQGVLGELYIGGVSLARCYLGRPDLTAEKFVKDPFSTDPSARLYRTGDLARWLPDGTVEFTGRIDHQVKIRGFRVELGEIEGTLSKHPAVKEAVVLAREDVPGDRRLVAYVVADAEASLAGPSGQRAPVTPALRAYLRERLPDYMLPSAIVLVDAMPLTPNGKVDRRALPAPGSARPELQEPFVPPCTETEVGLAQIWRESLGLDRVGVRDNFFELGGDSLRAVQVFARVRQYFGVDVTFQQLFARPTVAELAARIGETARAPLAAIERTSRDKLLPLSFAQERLWFLHQLAPDSPAYNCPYVFRLRGALDLSALRTSLRSLVQRHEILRTTFPDDQGRAFQCVHDELTVPLEHAQLSHLSGAEQEGALRTLLLSRVGKAFDLRRGPLLRAGVVRLGEGEHVFWLDMHHIVTDGRSMEVIFRELAAGYATASGGGELPAERALQYADFAVWQRGVLTDEVLAGLTDWWRERLRGAPALLELPTDYARPPVQDFRGAAVPFALGSELTESLRALGARNNMTLVMVVLAGFSALMQRYSRQDEVVIGIPSLGRDRVELEELVGFFVNTLPIRLDFSNVSSFSELLAQVRRESLDAFEHDALPFERLVQELQVERVASHNPIVQVAIAPQPPGERDLSLRGLSVESMEIESRRAVFDLTLFCWDTSEGMAGSLEYRTDLFQAGTIERLVGHLVTLLTNAVKAPDEALGALNLLSDAERRTLLVDWNDTARPRITDRCFHELFAEQARRTPRAIAVEEPSGRALTYAALDGRANQLARHLRTLGVKPDVLVGLSVERSVDLVIGVLAIMKAGGAYVPLDPTYPRDRLELMLEDARPVALVTQSHLESALPRTSAALVRLDSDAALLERLPATELEPLATPSSLAYVIYTSGSTGRPKGAMIEHRSLVNMAEAQRLGLDMRPEARVLQFASLSFDAAIWEMATTLTIGATLCMLPPGRPLLGAELGRFLHDHRISVATLPPSVLPGVPQELAAGVQTLVVAGEACSAELASTWSRGRRFINAYGPTECTVCATLTVCKPDGKAPSIGRPLANVRVYVLDRAQRPVPIGVAGELYIGGAGVGRGYLRRPELSAERFVADPFSELPLARMYRTGDLVRYRPNGELEFLGRLDQQIKLRGFRIELGEIEEALRSCDEVQDVAVDVRRDGQGEPRLVAYVVPAARNEAVENHVSSWQSLYDDIFESTSPVSDPGANFTGWNSSYTGEPIPLAEMEAWRANTVARIASLAPRKVWEIGCGTGLLLLPIAPQCAHYLGTDISRGELALLQQAVSSRGLSQVRLELRRADQFEGIAEGSVDTLVVNSVIQYFPDASYLLEVVRGALRTVRSGGAIFIGDVRSFPLHTAFRASIELARAASSATPDDLRPLIQRALASEPELLVDPRLFLDLARENPAVSHVEVLLKRGRHDNELESYRYDVIIHVGAREQPVAIDVSREFAALGGRLDDVERWLASERPETAELLAVPNTRVLAGVLAAEWMAGSAGDVAELRARVEREAVHAVHPEALWTLGERLGYSVRITYSHDGGARCMDVLFERREPSAPSRAWTPSSYRPVDDAGALTNDPMKRSREGSLGAKLRAHLEGKLPSYMVPSDFLLLPQLPLSPTGKVDRKALPEPESTERNQGDFVAPRSATELQIAQIWAELLGVARVGAHDNFFQLGGHSLMVSRVIFRIQDVLGTEVPMRAMYEAPTVAEIAQFIETSQREPGYESLCYTPTLVLEDEARLDEVVRAGTSAVDLSRPARHIFLTGATGFVGTHLLAELLERTQAEVHCLVRARTVAEGEQRLSSALATYGLSSQALRGRVHVVLGDLGEPRLGLDTETFERLAGTVDLICHNGAKVDHVRGYAHMKPANVLGTHEVLRLACAARLKPVHFVSTLGVIYPADYASEGVVSEDAPAGPLGRLPNGYMQSKCVAEHMLQEAMARGVPAAIYRLGAVSGHSQTGNCNPSDFTYSALRSTIELGFADNLDTDLTLTPIDFVARALVALMGRAASLGKVHHVTNPRPFSWLELVAALQGRGFDIRVVSYAECMQGLLQAARQGVDTPMVAFLPFVTQKVPGSSRYVNEDYHALVRWECENMLAGLTEAGVAAPPPPDKILDTYLDYLDRHGLLETGCAAGSERPRRTSDAVLKVGEEEDAAVSCSNSSVT